MTGPEESVLVRVAHLTKHFPIRVGAYGEKDAVVYAVDDVSFDVRAGETLSLVGESGCGKSTTGFTVLQLFRPTAGKCYYRGVDLTTLSAKQLRPMRQKMQIIFQDPYSTLNPRMTVGTAVAESLKVHKIVPKSEIEDRVAQLLSDVGLDRRCSNRYPHEFSGGQRQRISIARALACNPEFVVCDEPISALDVSIQAQIINLLQDLQAKYHLTYLFIAHDLAVVRHISNRVAAMYLGRLVEMAPKQAFFDEPLNPYTQALLSAVPIPNPKLERQRSRVLLQGDVPSAIDPPPGCRFHPRCPRATEKCRTEVPEWRQVDRATDHWVACHHV